MSTYAIQIQQTAMQLIQAGMPGTFKTFGLEPMLIINEADLPMVAVHIVRERRNALGDADIGPPKFRTELTLNISGSTKALTDEANQPSILEDWMSQLDTVLLRNPKFVNLSEGVLSMDRISQLAKVGETTLYEIRIEMVLQYTDWFEPIVPDDLKTIHVETRYPSPTSDPAEVQQVVAQYDLHQTQGTVADHAQPDADHQGLARPERRGSGPPRERPAAR
ncbi:hypothetical protein HAP48_0035005 [Bradyrhizobium septentrionale]|uniref:Uncharacterized protein n=1 Tax=Bradyrhizobium septentrionale TaxID=1404411 RepID=A0A973W0L4_9BRAD|nr:hypothetical protein [Bradyrhizobium septentrionale]UGY13743.1 hypothetical protein HAP48_0035005 [Bradyrhizobium septentrionale]